MSERKRYGVRSLRFKLVLASTLVEIVMLGVLVWNSTRIADHALIREFESRAAMLVPLLNASIAPALAERDFATLDDLLEKIVQRESVVYIEVRDALNRRVSTRGPVPQSEVTDASLRHADEVLDQGLDIKIGGSVVGRVRYGINVDLLDITVDQLRWQGIAIAAAEVVLTLGLLALLGYLLTRHLRQLSDAARNMEDGDYETFLPEKGSDEVADTARAFNTMARAVEHSLHSLQKNQALLKAITDNTSAVIYVKDLDGRFMLVNREFERIVGLSNAQIKGKTNGEFLAPEIGDALRANDLRVLDQKAALQFEEFLPQPDGLHSYLSVKFPLLDEAGNAYATAGLCTDITQRKHTEEALRGREQQLATLATQLEQRVLERTTQLEAANKELEAFAYAVSHDLRAPLRAIDGFSQALIDDYAAQLDATGQGYLDRVRAATQRMGILIDDLLLLSRATRQDMTRQDVDLSALVQEIVVELTRREPQRAVEIVIALGVHGPGDARLLRVVLDNLLNNAWKYTSKKPAARIEFGVAGQPDERVYYVRDDGAGFDMRYASKLFGAFQRMHKAESFPGTGVGLATAARVIRRHGGRIWAEAEVDKGAVFYFTLSSGEGST